MTGRVIQLGVKPKTPGQYGLPKHPVPALVVSASGAEGDYNRYRTEELQGDADQALLLLTEQVLEQLRAEGWPVAPGDLGENVTLGGIEEGSLHPGVRLRLGAVVVEITKACVPCSELYALPYVGKERGPAMVKALMGRRGWYARVHAGGRLEVAAPVTLLPAATLTEASP